MQNVAKMIINEKELCNNNVISDKWWKIITPFNEIEKYYKDLKKKVLGSDKVNLFISDNDNDILNVLNECMDIKEAQNLYKNFYKLDDEQKLVVEAMIDNYKDVYEALEIAKNKKYEISNYKKDDNYVKFENKYIKW